MKWKQASVASAVALAVAGGLVSAPAVASVQTITGGGNAAELTLFVWDPTAGYAYMRDLGPTQWTTTTAASVMSGAADVSTLFGSSLSFTGDANYQTFLADLAAKGYANSSTTYWGVYSAAGGAQSYMLTTFDANIATSDIVVGQNLVMGTSPVSAWSSIANAMPTYAGSTETPADPSNNGSAVTSSTDPSSPTAYNVNWGQGWVQAGNTRTFDQFGVSMTSSFYVVRKGTSGVTFKQLTGTWALDATTGDLTYSVASVPEPGTWGLSLIGLALVGFVSWRRRGV